MLELVWNKPKIKASMHAGHSWHAQDYLGINTFIQQGCIYLIKSDCKDVYIVTKIQIFAVLIHFVKEIIDSSKNSEKKNIKNIKKHNCFQHLQK